ncbi:hypothetical protein [Albirhodobacter sp. R86504]|uniref:hypothetical protein n=1 Tax=Albirhodobacter sp. R86504 TaxID=3093848 RepID=UPI00366A9807
MSNSDHQTRTTLEAGPRLRSGRAPHVVLGILAGLTLWALDEVSGAGEVGRIAAALTILAWIGFSASGVLLAYLGPARAVRTGAILGGLVGALAWVSMGGFATPQGFFNAGHPTTALLVLAILPLPFLTCFYRGTGISYRHLYIESWDILVRSAAAWAFAGLVLAVAFASAELLRLVGVELLHDLLREDMVIAILLGGTVGLGLAVVAELNDMISPDLALRLVRLLTPFVLLVLAVFLAMVPVRGLTALFGSVSTGGA